MKPFLSLAIAKEDGANLCVECRIIRVTVHLLPRDNFLKSRIIALELLKRLQLRHGFIVFALLAQTAVQRIMRARTKGIHGKTSSEPWLRFGEPLVLEGQRAAHVECFRMIWILRRYASYQFETFLLPLLFQMAPRQRYQDIRVLRGEISQPIKFAHCFLSFVGFNKESCKTQPGVVILGIGSKCFTIISQGQCSHLSPPTWAV